MKGVVMNKISKLFSGDIQVLIDEPEKFIIRGYSVDKINGVILSGQKVVIRNFDKNRKLITADITGRTYLFHAEQVTFIIEDNPDYGENKEDILEKDVENTDDVILKEDFEEDVGGTGAMYVDDGSEEEGFDVSEYIPEKKKKKKKKN